MILKIKFELDDDILYQLEFIRNNRDNLNIDMIDINDEIYQLDSNFFIIKDDEKIYLSNEEIEKLILDKAFND